MIEQIILGLGGAAIFVGAAAWLTRSIVIHFLSKDFERFKQELATQSAAEVTRLKHSLELTASEHSKRISILLEHREELIAKLYVVLNGFFVAAEAFAELDASIPEDERSRNNSVRLLEKKVAEFRELFYPNQIYFSETTAARLRELFEGVGQRATKFRALMETVGAEIWFASNKQRRIQESEIRAHADLAAVWTEAAAFIAANVPPARVAVERELRELLGVIKG